LRTKKQITEIIECLEKEYSIAECALHYTKDYELLFAVRLSAQCTDKRVNEITPALFEHFPTLESFANADIKEVEHYVHSCGFYHAKASDIVNSAKILIEKHDSKVPGTMEELTALPGIGRKTANLILGDIYHVPGSTVVDTHCIRLTNRIGLVEGTKDPQKIEMQLRKLIPAEKSMGFCHRIVLHGRAICKAQKPDCENCCIKQVCKSYGKI